MRRTSGIEGLWWRTSGVEGLRWGTSGVERLMRWSSGVELMRIRNSLMVHAVRVRDVSVSTLELSLFLPPGPGFIIVTSVTSIPWPENSCVTCKVVNISGIF